MLTPDTAHGTNPATCTVCGRHAMTVASRPDGRVDLDDLRSKVDEQTAALMITNPNTAGLFDTQIAEIAEILHAKGALLYLDGANMNAILGHRPAGRLRRGRHALQHAQDLQHAARLRRPGGRAGGGGRAPARSSCPVRRWSAATTARTAGPRPGPKSIGRVRSFYGQIGVLVRAYAYIRALGPDGLRDVSEKAVLSANYLAARLRGHYDLPFEPPYAHEFIMVPEFREHGVTELDVAKRLIDHSIHPPTMSWPVRHCLMIEPTECESLATLDQFVESMIRIADEAREHPDVLHHAPLTMPVHRLDEVTAARKPDLRWTPPEGTDAAGRTPPFAPHFLTSLAHCPSGRYAPAHGRHGSLSPWFMRSSGVNHGSSRRERPWLITLFVCAAGGPASAEFLRGPYLQNVTQDSITICWDTPKPCGATISLEDRAADVTIEKKTRQEVKLDGLTANRRYRYTVTLDDGTKADGTLQRRRRQAFPSSSPRGAIREATRTSAGASPTASRRPASAWRSTRAISSAAAATCRSGTRCSSTPAATCSAASRTTPRSATTSWPGRRSDPTGGPSFASCSRAGQRDLVQLRLR